MTTKVFKFAFTALAICATTYSLQQLSSNENGEELIMSNIEALANSESGDTAWGCAGTGSIYCHGYYSKYSFSGLSLDDFE